MSVSDVSGPVERVLVVDDSVDTAKMMKLLLKREGYDARTAHDGSEALRVAADFRPEIILLDLNLPGLSGHEVAEELRKCDELSGALIVAVSGCGEQGNPPPGFDHLLIKPVDHDALKSLLSSHCPNIGEVQGT